MGGDMSADGNITPMTSHIGSTPSCPSCGQPMKPVEDPGPWHLWTCCNLIVTGESKLRKPVDIAALKQLLAEATLGHWTADVIDGDTYVVRRDPGAFGSVNLVAETREQADAALIAVMRNQIVSILDRLELLENVFRAAEDVVDDAAYDEAGALCDVRHEKMEALREALEAFKHDRPLLAARNELLEGIVRDISKSDPVDTIDYESGSEVTGPSAISGCVYCREEHMGSADEFRHKPECIWRRAREVMGK
jgi:hypothetical protein